MPSDTFVRAVPAVLACAVPALYVECFRETFGPASATDR